MEPGQRRANRIARKLVLVLGLALAGGFVLAGLWLLLLGFEVGEVYPPYSSLRADADGTEVLYEALERFDSSQVERNYLPLQQVRLAPETTFLVAGVTPNSWDMMSRADALTLRAMAEQGARIVIAFNSQVRRPRFVDLLDDEQPDEKEQEEQKEQKDQPDRQEKDKTRRAGKQPEKGAAEAAFGFRFQTGSQDPQGKKEPPGKTPAMAHPQGGVSLPPEIPWPGRSRLEPVDPAWKTLLRLENGNVVALERSLANGRIIVLADSYLLTNEAMWKSRQTAFLHWLTDGGGPVIFDESHLGVADKPGLTNLVNRYRLHGVIAALLFVFALFVWRNRFPLVPVSAHALDHRLATPAESGTGLAELVRRSIPEGRLLTAAVQEWSKTSQVDDETLARIEDIAARTGSESALKRDVVSAYGQIQDELSRSVSRFRGHRFRGQKRKTR